MPSQVWFITGVSSGLGLELALTALEQQHKVIGTVRSRQRASSAVTRIEEAGGKVLELDVTQADQCFDVFQTATQIHGHIDVFCNNAGMSYLGTIEDFTDEEIHKQMEVNLYGPLRLIRAALPGFRNQRSGYIVNMSSVSGMAAFPSMGIYTASKFALEGVSETLAKEVADHNVKVLIVEPGAFRTNFLGAYQMNSEKTIEEYSTVKGMVDMLKKYAGKQPGDPVKAAKIIVDVVGGTGKAGELSGKILRLPLGPDCLAALDQKMDSLRSDIDKGKEFAASTNVDGYVPPS